MQLFKLKQQTYNIDQMTSSLYYIFIWGIYYLLLLSLPDIKCFFFHSLLLLIIDYCFRRNKIMLLILKVMDAYLGDPLYRKKLSVAFFIGIYAYYNTVS